MYAKMSNRLIWIKLALTLFFQSGECMAYISVADVVAGLVVEEDVKDRNGRLIISCGITIEEKHLRILKTWGVTKIAVQSAQKTPAPEVVDKASPEYIEAVKMIRRRFRFNPGKHPLIALLKDMAVHKKLTKS